MSDTDLDTWIDAFDQHHKNERILVGEYLRQPDGGSTVTNRDGRILKAFDSDTELTTNYDYGADGAFVKSITTDHDNKIVQTTYAGNHTTAYHYGPDGKLADIVNWDGTRFSTTDGYNLLWE